MTSKKVCLTKTLRLIFIMLLLGCIVTLNAQTNFALLGANDSGGSGFKTMTNNANLVVSNVMVNDGTEMYTGTQYSSFSIKAYGIEDFNFEEMTLRGYTSTTDVDASSTVVFKDKDGLTLQTMTLISEKRLPTSAIALSSFFDNGTTTPINNVAEIVFDLKTPVQHYTMNYNYVDITISESGGATPITLSSFTATAKAGVVELSWETASETNNASFVIYRNDEVLATVEGAGTTSETNNYVYTDATVVPGVAYTYVLADVDLANTLTRYDNKAVTVTVGNSIAEADFKVGVAYPNPFNPTTIIPLELSNDSYVIASLYDIRGKQIRSLVNSTMSAGSKEVQIDGSDLTSGIYVVKVNVGNTVNMRKVLLAK